MSQPQLLLDPKALEGKSANEQLIAVGEFIRDELAKDALKRNNEHLAALTKQFEEYVEGLQKRLEERFPNFSLPGMPVGTGKEQFSLARAAVAYRRGEWSLAPFEHSVFNSKEHLDFIQKTASFGVDVAGGFLIPAEVSSKLIAKLQPATIAFQLGVGQMDLGNVASMTFNRQTGDATADWVGEMQTAAKSDLAYQQFTVSPKALSARGDISNLLQLLGSNEAEQRFIDNASMKFAQGIDRAILIGPSTVSPKAPIGIAGTSGVQTSSSASLTYNKLLDFEDKLRTANAYRGKLGWAMSEAQYTVVRKLVDSANQPLMLRSLTEKGLREIFGFPVYTTTQMGTTGANTLAFGDWSQATFFRWFGGVILMRSNTSDTALDTDVTRVAMRIYGDVGVEQPTAFVYASD